MPDEGERLQKVLARAGVGSRRTNEILIAERRVTVNGEVAVLGRRVDPQTDRIALDGVPVIVDATVVHWVLNKPAGYVTTAHDTHGRPTVLDLVPGEPRVFPVGRLDLDRVVLPVRLDILLRVEPADAQGDVHQCSSSISTCVPSADSASSQPACSRS